MPKRYWLVKSDPDTYGWPEFVEAGEDCWDGVRNYQARNNLREMQVGDEVLFYHSQKERSVVGTATVSRAAYPDPTTDDDRWVAVDLKVGEALPKPVELKAIKATASLAEIPLVKTSRLSVMPLPAKAFRTIVKMGH